MRADDELLGLLRAEPAQTGVFVDFDGTLAPIVLDPASAAPAPGVVDALLSLQTVGYRVAVLSGRPVSFLARHLPDVLDVYGLYGLEQRVDGVLGVAAEAASWGTIIDALAARAAIELPEGAEVEHKGLSLTLHTRRAPEVARAVKSWAAGVAASTGLLVRTAKQSIELHPPVAADKGTVLMVLLTGLSAACFIGDDAGDLPAFDALDRFQASGGHAVRIAVVTDETVPEMRARADLKVPDQPAVVELLRSLV